MSRFSRYIKLLRVTARVLSVFRRGNKPTLKNMLEPPTREDIGNAEVYLIKTAQLMICDKLQKGGFQRLCPIQRGDGVYIVKGRAEQWLMKNYNEEGLILLPHEYVISKLYAEYIHNLCHLGSPIFLS